MASSFGAFAFEGPFEAVVVPVGPATLGIEQELVPEGSKRLVVAQELVGLVVELGHPSSGRHT